MAQIFEILIRRDLDLYANGPKSFPPGFFTHFWRLTAKNYESVFLTVVRKMVLLTVVRPKPGWVLLRYDHGSNFQNFDLEKLWTCTSMVLKVSLQVFNHFGRSLAENYESVFLTVVRPNGAFDLRAIKTCFRSL